MWDAATVWIAQNIQLDEEDARLPDGQPENYGVARNLVLNSRDLILLPPVVDRRQQELL